MVILSQVHAVPMPVAAALRAPQRDAIGVVALLGQSESVGAVCQPCGRNLPSGHYAEGVVNGDWNAVLPAVGSTLVRALLISVGAYAAGVRDKRNLIAGALGGAAAIEAFVLAYYAWNRGRR